MLKSVAMATLTYVKSCVRLPKGLCLEITKAMATFSWGGGEDKRN